MPGGDIIDGVVIWPASIDAEKAKSAGRKIPAKKAVPSPTIKEIEAAAKKLGLEPRSEKGKAHPREHWERRGLVRVKKTKGKTQILADIAGEIKKARG